MGLELTMQTRLGVGSSRETRSWTALGIAVLLLVLGAWLVLAHVLVNLFNSREDQPVVPGSIAPGSFVSGQLTLSNRGWLPISISLEPTSRSGELPAHISVKIQDSDDHSFLYVGPLQKSMGPLLVLDPGRDVRILLTLISDDPQGTAAVPLPLTYYWDAVPALPWWWWIPPVLIVGSLLYLGFRHSGDPSA